MKKPDADPAFRQWKLAHPEVKLRDDQVRIDTIRSADEKVLVRYRIYQR